LSVVPSDLLLISSIVPTIFFNKFSIISFLQACENAHCQFDFRGPDHPLFSAIYSGEPSSLFPWIEFLEDSKFTDITYSWFATPLNLYPFTESHVEQVRLIYHLLVVCHAAQFIIYPFTESHVEQVRRNRSYEI
jgi:hypothetical protein